MILDSLILALLLPPLPPVHDDLLPKEVEQASIYETINPYVCINKTNDLLKKNNNTDSISTDQKFKIMLKNFSCSITAGSKTKIKDIEKFIQRNKLKQDDPEKFYYYYNIVRANEILNENNQLPNWQTDISSQNNEFFPYLILINITQLLKNDSYHDALTNAYAIVSNENFQNYPPTLKAAFYIAMYCIYTQKEENNKAVNFLKNAEDNLNSSYTNYSKAVVSEKISDIFNRLGDNKQSAFYSEIAVGIIESIPEENYHTAITFYNLAENYLQLNDPDNAYFAINKANIYFGYANNTNNTDINKYKNIISEGKLCFLQGKILLIKKDWKNAIKNLEASAVFFRLNKDEKSAIQAEVLIIEGLIGDKQNEKAKQLISKNLKQINKLEPQTQVELYKTIAELNNKENNYKSAYSYLKQAFQTLNQQKNHIIDSSRSAAFSEILVNKINNPKNKDVFRFGDLKDFMPTIIGLTIAFLLYLLLLKISHRNKSLLKQIENNYENMPYGKNIMIPGLMEFNADITSLKILTNISTSEEVKFSVDEREIFIFSIPSLNLLDIQIGWENASQIIKLFQSKLLSLYTQDKIYMLSHDQYIFMRKPNSEISTKESAEEFLKKISTLLSELKLPTVLSAGIINFPFIIKNPGTLSASALLEAALTALAGAKYLTTCTNTSTWVHLNSINTVKKEEKNQDTEISTPQQEIWNRKKFIEYIVNGTIHVTSSGSTELIDWENMLLH